VFVVAYRPAFLGDADAGTYIDAAHGGLFANIYDPAGYPLFLRVVHSIWPSLTVVIILQHALGVGAAWLFYRIVFRLTGSPWAASIPAAVVLLDGYGLWVEHTPITETVFAFLVALSLYLALGTERQDGWTRAAEGLVIGVAATIRPVGLTLLPVLALWAFWTRGGRWSSRVIATVAVVAPACAILGAYVLIQRADTGFTGITRDSGRVMYARVATFADCSQFSPPPGTRALCESTPAGERGSFNQYLTGFPDRAAGVSEVGRSISPAWRVFGPPPAGNARLAAFVRAAVIAQPLDYLNAVANDFHYYWSDHHRAFIDAAADPDPNVERAVRAYYGTAGPSSEGVGFLRWYGETIELTGALMIILLVVPALGILFSNPERRPAVILLATIGWLLPLAADAAASVDPRFILPAYGPLAAAGAVGLVGAPARIRSAIRKPSVTQGA
jgi:hypothetical protein